MKRQGNLFISDILDLEIVRPVERTFGRALLAATSGELTVSTQKTLLDNISTFRKMKVATSRRQR
jgi:hypothetical protein